MLTTRELRRDRHATYGRWCWEDTRSYAFTDTRPFQWANIGPVVRARVFTPHGPNRWRTVAITTAPHRYISAVAVVGDLTRHNIREGSAQ